MMRFIKVTVVLGACSFGALSAFAQADPFLGQISIVGFNYAPQGWAMCNGQLLSIAQNTALFSLLGTQYGGDGESTFALPDLRGRFPLGAGQGPGLSPRTQGETGGAEQYTLTVAQLPAHTHPLAASKTEATVTSPTGALLGTKARVPLYAPAGNFTTMSTLSIGSTGGTQPHPAMPPYLVLNYIIALEGIYPSRN